VFVLESNRGINVVGYVHDQSGLAAIARLVVESLRVAGIPYAVVPYGPQPLASRLRVHEMPYDTNIVCVNPDVLPALVERYGRSAFRDRRTIGFWWWEVESFPPTLAAAAHLVDEIWVGSAHVARAIAACVAKPVHIFPVPILRTPAPSVPRAELGLPLDAFTFLFTFSFRSVFARKNPLGLVDAFERAFAPDEGPVLVLKSSHSSWHPRELAELKTACAPRHDIVLVDRPLEEQRYRALLAAADAYVSLHRAEGFGLTIAEAMALGKPAIATAYSGNLEFMTEENSYLVPYTLAEIPRGTDPYPSHTPWAEPDVDEAARAMRTVFERPDEAGARAARALADIESRHTLEVAAAFVAQRLAADVVIDRRLPEESLERAVWELMWGPDFERARPFARRLRSVLRPFLRPYVEQQRLVGTLLADAIRARGDSDRRPG
jgi:glycosyltransferase involved in cell wall biosynthesis